MKLENNEITVFLVFHVASRHIGLRSAGSLWAQQGSAGVHLRVRLSKRTHGGQLRSRLETGPQHL